MTSAKTTKKPTSVATWKKQNQLPLIELPSGNCIRMKKVSLQTIMATGMVPNSLLGIVQKSVNRGTGREDLVEQELAKMVIDQDKLRELLEFMSRMMCFVSAEPEIHMPPGDGVERDPELLYADEVEEEDKMFIFQVVTGGTTDLAEFRREHGAAMDTLRRVQDVELPTE